MGRFQQCLQLGLLLPVVLTSWQEWQEQHPETVVLDRNTGFDRMYLPGAAYGHYFDYDKTMFPVWQRSELLETKAQIYALRIDGMPKAYPIDILAEEKVVNDTLGIRRWCWSPCGTRWKLPASALASEIL